MTTQEVLQQCTVAGMVVKLPDVTLDRKEYLDVASKLQLIGGKWKGGKVQGFVFQENPTGLLAEIAGGENRNIKKEYQFFATPKELARKIVALADPASYDDILEPSAGQGAIIEAINSHCNPDLVFCYELMPLNQTFLNKISNAKIIGSDFLTHNNKQFDRIIANPPFTKNQDIDHIRHMYKHLKDGGRLVSIASTSWRNGSQKKQVEFTDWLIRVHAKIEEIEAGAFKESGTNVATVIITINKAA